MPVYRNELQKVQVLNNIVELFKTLPYYAFKKVGFSPPRTTNAPGSLKEGLHVLQVPEAQELHKDLAIVERDLKLLDQIVAKFTADSSDPKADQTGVVASNSGAGDAAQQSSILQPESSATSSRACPTALRVKLPLRPVAANRQGSAAQAVIFIPSTAPTKPRGDQSSESSAVASRIPVADGPKRRARLRPDEGETEPPDSPTVPRITRARRILQPIQAPAHSPIQAVANNAANVEPSPKRRARGEYSPAVRTRSMEFVLVCYGLTTSEEDVVRKCTAALGGRWAPFFQAHTTHIVLGSAGAVTPGIRALTAVTPVAVVGITWVKKSLKHEGWLLEGPYGIPSLDEAHRTRIAEAKSARPRCLDKCRVLLYGTFGGEGHLSLADLEQVVLLCGGRVVTAEAVLRLMPVAAGRKRDQRSAGNVIIVVPGASEVRPATDMGLGSVVPVQWLYDSVCDWEPKDPAPYAA